MSSTTEVISNWSTLIENFQFSPQKFYEMVAEAVTRRKMPNASISKVKFKEGNFLLANREYLKVYCGKENFYFAICGGTFGTGFSFRTGSYRFLTAVWFRCSLRFRFYRPLRKLWSRRGPIIGSIP
jgi:hypothetical protein